MSADDLRVIPILKLLNSGPFHGMTMTAGNQLPLFIRGRFPPDSAGIPDTFGGAAGEAPVMPAHGFGFQILEPLSGQDIAEEFLDSSHDSFWI